MAKPKQLEEPHKELRFTRAAQAQLFFIIAAIFLAVTILLTFLGDHPDIRWWMPILAVLPAIYFVKIALFCTRHAYLILTPLGLEVFPFRKPDENLEVRFWSEFTAADFDDDLTQLMLHTNAQKTAGLVISLNPIALNQRPLLKKAIQSRLREIARD